MQLPGGLAASKHFAGQLREADGTEREPLSIDDRSRQHKRGSWRVSLNMCPKRSAALLPQSALGKENLID